MTTDSDKPEVGPCGIVCGFCPLGSGAVAETAERARGFLEGCNIPDWAPLVSEEGCGIDWHQVVEGLEWMRRYALCPGCESGGGPPDCPIRVCAREKGLDLCSFCGELESCGNFGWLGDRGEEMKDAMRRARGVSREEYVNALQGGKSGEG
ncbi:MAG: DUF3795 domain-containing protein [Methanothrix sp.]|jgi:hypothetical protein|nr:DUF3795 domain-containing protein [Methanothrix sp.]OPX81589.1 MAG: hypothetical protein A4E50_00915 [Methanosaeta sp. PtaB.Bin087]OPY56551.1 MAG: hypothetical protein A4E51_00368 [Methanosaeta sp. PtaU1.Bin055]NLX38576.1 DUF3795 domain-containing protein [Methanothrix sp.]HOI70404.1 DUF3795 domain-containing protein [Methanothrix sp.]